MPHAIIRGKDGRRHEVDSPRRPKPGCSLRSRKNEPRPRPSRSFPSASLPSHPATIRESLRIGQRVPTRPI